MILLEKHYLFFLILFISIVSCSPQEGTKELQYTLDDYYMSGSISGITDKDVTKIVIPPIKTISKNKYKITSIGYRAFNGCEKIDSLIIPSGIEEIKEEAFYGCRRLKYISIPKSVTIISKNAFDDCPSLNNIVVDDDNKNYASKDGMLYDKTITTLLFCPKGKKGVIKIAETVTTISEKVFLYHYMLDEVILPNTLTSIGDYAFKGCDIKSIEIPNSVT